MFSLFKKKSSIYSATLMPSGKEIRVKRNNKKSKYSLFISGYKLFIKVKHISPTNPELPLSISQNELLKVK